MSAERTASGVAVDALVERLGAAVHRVVGPRDRTVTHPAPIDAAMAAGAITFCSRTGEAATAAILATAAAVVLCGRGVEADALAEDGPTVLVVDDPRLAFIRVVEAFFTGGRPRGVHPTAIVDAGARVAADAYVGPGTYVGAGCVVDAGSVIHGHVYLYPGTRIGRNVTVHAGTVIGADGFGYQRNEAGEFEKFPHVGGVVIEDDVEIGANTCIDRGTLGDTIIRQGAKVDNLVHVAHNVVVGRHAAVIAHAMIGGSTRIGDHAWVAPCACVRDGLSVGEGATLGLGAVVVKDVTERGTVMGAPARPADEYRVLLAALKRLGATAPESP